MPYYRTFPADTTGLPVHERVAAYRRFRYLDVEWRPGAPYSVAVVDKLKELGDDAVNVTDDEIAKIVLELGTPPSRHDWQAWAWGAGFDGVSDYLKLEEEKRAAAAAAKEAAAEAHEEKRRTLGFYTPLERKLVGLMVFVGAKPYPWDHFDRDRMGERVQIHDSTGISIRVYRGDENGMRLAVARIRLAAQYHDADKPKDRDLRDWYTRRVWPVLAALPPDATSALVREDPRFTELAADYVRFTGPAPYGLVAT